MHVFIISPALNLLGHRKGMWHCANSYEYNRWNSESLTRKNDKIYTYRIWNFTTHAHYLIWLSQLKAVRAGMMSIFTIRSQVWDISFSDRSLATTIYLTARGQSGDGPARANPLAAPSRWLSGRAARQQPRPTTRSAVGAAHRLREWRRRSHGHKPVCYRISTLVCQCSALGRECIFF